MGIVREGNECAVGMDDDVLLLLSIGIFTAVVVVVIVVAVDNAILLLLLLLLDIFFVVTETPLLPSFLPLLFSFNIFLLLAKGSSDDFLLPIPVLSILYQLLYTFQK
jgi:hypothetical protein